MPSFDLQVERLLALGYPELLGCPPDAFRRRLEPLRAHVPGAADIDVQRGTLPFCIAIHAAAAPVAAVLPRVRRNGHAAVEKLFPRAPEFFRPLPSLGIEPGCAYLLLDIDRGNDSLNAVPSAAQKRLEAAARSPLTVEEGVAVLAQCPEFLQPNRCFMLLGSRGDDKRVPALWLSGKQPKLGWCWEGNPHTWLGFASCASRSPGVAIAGAAVPRRDGAHP
jgi:hypothetical protein